MVERFFSIAQTDLKHEFSSQIMLLSGPPSSGKTSLLFQFAINIASLTDTNKANTDYPMVVFICNRNKLQSKPPFLSQGIVPSSHIFQRIQMKSCQERYGNQRGKDMAMLRILALCHDAVMHANEKGQGLLLLSDTHRGEIPRLLFIYKRWVSSIFTIKGDGDRAFFLSNAKFGNENAEKTRTAKYSIALQHLILEGIAEGEDTMP